MNHEDQELRRDASVVASDGPVGHVSHVIVDRSTNTVTEIVVEHGGQAWLVPYDAVAAVEDNVVRLHTSWSDAPVEAFDRGEFRAARLEPNTVLEAYSCQGGRTRRRCGVNQSRRSSSSGLRSAVKVQTKVQAGN